ncbi:uncharacterized protein LOC119073800 [Bradysia coprophila]|uniref:uncharacterized protein LOC119073800 n=1 Tax=Bradysia coprophila TaxID=38358 RepID=UPI00187D7046|nr:uncharacterized protein LOC119073800 [Bradysia coprophila]
MFTSSEINASSSADSVRKSNDMFIKFSAQVFASHFRETRARLGLAAAIPVDLGGKIAELGSSAINTTTTSHALGSYEEEYGDYVPHPRTDFNSPVNTWMYTDVVRKLDFVCVLVPMLTGTTNVDFTLPLDGLSLDIEFTWPRPVFDASVLFREQIKKKTLNMSDPEVHAFCMQQSKNNITAKNLPTSRISVKLPCKVMREPSTWKKTTSTIDGLRMVYMKFTAMQKEMFIEEADTSLKWD